MPTNNSYADLSRIDDAFEALNKLLDASGALDSEPLQLACYSLRMSIARAQNDSSRMQAAERSLQQMNHRIAEFDLKTFDGWIGAAKALLADKPPGTALDDSEFQGYLVLVQGILYAIPTRAVDNNKVQTEWGIPVDAYEPDASVWSTANQAWEAHSPIQNRDVLLMPKFVSLVFQEHEALHESPSQLHLSQISDPMRELADEAFAHYDFGDSVTVIDTSGWECSTPGHERARKVYVESQREDDALASSWILSFTVRFDPSTGELTEAFALDDKGQKWGAMPDLMAEKVSPVQSDESDSMLRNFPFVLEFSTMNDLPEIGVSCQDVFVTNPFYDHGMTTKVDPMECWGMSNANAQFIVDLNDELGEAVEDAINAACLRLQNVVGIKDGGFAGAFFSGHEIRRKMMEVFAEYITVDFNSRDFEIEQKRST